jgi:protein tyrosine/serine phosphatase
MRSFGPIILLVLVLAGAGWWVFWSYFDTYHLAAVRDGVLYRDGLRSLHQFDLATRKIHEKTVVCLVDDQEMSEPPFRDEAAYCQSRGIELVRVPVGLGGWPDGDQIRQFLAIATDSARQPVLVHCAQGVRRTGMMVAAYQRTVLNLDKDKTIAAIRSFGHSQRTVDDVKRFIEVYDPQTQRMTRQLEPSQE